jgi:hypothetical protein
MKHLTDGQLRAYLDGELNEEQKKHLNECPTCQAHLPAIQAAAQRAGGRLGFLSFQPEGRRFQQLPPYLALARFKSRLIDKKETTMFKKIFGSRTLWIGLAAVIVLVLAFSVSPVRSFAGQFLGLFRVQQVSVIAIDTTGISQLNGDSALGKQIGQLLSSSVKMTEKPGQPQSAATAEESGQLAGFTVRLPGAQAIAPQLTVQGGTAFSFVVDRARAQALLDETGHKDLVLPASLNGANIDVNIPASVTAAYGNCPKPDPDGEGLNMNSNGSPGRRYADCVILAQIPSPTVNTPPDVDLEQLAEIGLQFTGMTPEQAHAFSQTVDWTTSLVIPIPKNAATYQQVNVDGVNGTLIQRPFDDGPEYALIWVKNGIIYAISGLGSDSAKAIAMANAMQ